jgi:3-hydroxy-9,10-secoandrosta-1,3,5(10)-triene-9,17-dione monooxygenase reductase component
MTALQADPDTGDIDGRVFRNTIGHYASGLTIVSGMRDGAPVGFTCQSFYSVSVDPPLVSFSVMKTSTTYPLIRETESFAVNVLAHHQRDVSDQFARSGTDKWRGIDWSATTHGNPAIDDTLMWVDCAAWAEYEVGDHYIVVGRVREMSPAEWHRHEPLIYFKGAYRLLSELT